MDHYKVTIDSFNKLAKAYQEKFMHLDLYNETYHVFCDLLKPGSSVFEIGCGPGNITHYLLKQRSDLHVIGMDAAPNMVELAKHNNPGAEFLVMDCKDIIGIKKSFDAVVCGFCMPYLSKEDCRRLITDSASIINSNGIFYTSVIEGDYKNSDFETSSNGEAKAYVYYYSKDFISETMLDAGFELVEFFRLPYQKGNHIQYHLIFIARKKN